MEIDLGTSPVANRLADRPDEDQPEYPLAVVLCPACGLAQLSVAVAADELFGDAYPYYSSFSQSYLDYARGLATEISRRSGLREGGRVVEIGCNDGYLLRWLAAAGADCVGIEPSVGPAAAAAALGLSVRQVFFGPETARQIRQQEGPAEVVIANHVLAHTPSPMEMLRGIATLLTDGGWLVAEVHDLGHLIDHAAFDTIYHEHHCYYSLTALAGAVERAGLVPVDVETPAVHGRVLRLWARKGAFVPGDRLRQRLEEESRGGIASPGALSGLATRIEDLRRVFERVRRDVASTGGRLAGFGAAAKSVTLCKSFGLSSPELAYVVDSNPAKQDRYLPNIGAPIFSPDHLRDEPATHVVIFPWNIADELCRQLQGLADYAVVPIPDMRLLPIGGRG